MLEPQKYYHIYNRANGFENLFVKEDNYSFFLDKMHHYLASMVEVCCYCLMPNHFHLLVKVKSKEEMVETIERKKGNQYLQGFKNLEGIDKYIVQQFSNLFNAYSKAFNKQQNRTGSLFQKGFKRKEITGQDYLKELVLYIHCNAVHHGFTENFEKWKFSSYHQIIKEKNSEVISWFDDIDNFKDCHQVKNEFNKIKNLLIE